MGYSGLIPQSHVYLPLAGYRCDPVPGSFSTRRGDSSVTSFQRKDLDQLQRMPDWIEEARQRVKRLRDRAALHSVSLDGMPHGSGVRDKIGETVPEILDAEKDLQKLEGTYTELRAQVADWIDAQEDIKAQVILSMRYLDSYSWNQIADECTGCGDPMTEDAVRKYAARYLKTHMSE